MLSQIIKSACLMAAVASTATLQAQGEANTGVTDDIQGSVLEQQVVYPPLPPVKVDGVWVSWKEAGLQYGNIAFFFVNALNPPAELDSSLGLYLQAIRSHSDVGGANTIAFAGLLATYLGSVDSHIDQETLALELIDVLSNFDGCYSN